MDERLAEDPLIPELVPESPSQNPEIDAILRQLQRLAIHPDNSCGGDNPNDDDDDDEAASPCRFGSDPGLVRIGPGTSATLRPPAYRPLVAAPRAPLPLPDCDLDAAPFAPSGPLALPSLSLLSPTQTPSVSPPSSLAFSLFPQSFPPPPSSTLLPPSQQRQEREQREQEPQQPQQQSDYLLEAPPDSERLPPHLWPSGARETLYRTKPCAFFFHTGRCQKGAHCNFSHELLPGVEVPPLPTTSAPGAPPIALGSTPRATPPRSPTCAAAAPTSPPFFRTKPCRFFFERGACLKGAHCNFSHDPASLAFASAAAPSAVAAPPASQPQAVPQPARTPTSCSAPPQLHDRTARFYRSVHPGPVHVPPPSQPPQPSIGNDSLHFW